MKLCWAAKALPVFPIIVDLEAPWEVRTRYAYARTDSEIIKIPFLVNPLKFSTIHLLAESLVKYSKPGVS